MDPTSPLLALESPADSIASNCGKDDPTSSRSSQPSSKGIVEGHVALLSSAGAEGLSAAGLTVNLTMSILGTTVLGIAAQMKRGGWILAPALVCLAGLVVGEMTRLVSFTIDQLRWERGLHVRTYQDFAGGALGVWGRRLSAVTSTCDLLVYTFIALVLEAENMQCLFPIDWRWLGRPDSGSKWWACLLSSLTCLYCFVDLGPLVRFSAAVGPAVCCLMMLLTLAGSVQAITDLPSFPSVCRDAAALPYWSAWPGDAVGDDSVAPRLAGVASYCLFCFAVVATVPSVQSTMREPSKLGVAGSRAFGMSSAAFVCIMALAYWGFGNLGPENLVEGAAQGFVERWGTPASAALRLGLVLARLLVAVGVSSFIALSSLTSSLFCTANNVLIPIAAFYRVGGGEGLGIARKFAHLTIFVVACSMAVLGTVHSLQTIVFPPHFQLERPGVFPRGGISQECQSAYASVTRGLV